MIGFIIAMGVVGSQEYGVLYDLVGGTRASSSLAHSVSRNGCLLPFLVLSIDVLMKRFNK